MIDDSTDTRVPDWFVTFADMMTLLLTFFIMLVSFSELRSQEKYESLMDVFQEQFGYHGTRAEYAMGQVRPRCSQLSKMAGVARSQRIVDLEQKSQNQVINRLSDDSAANTATSATTPGSGLYLPRVMERR